MAQTINIQKLWDQRYRDESVPFPISGSVDSSSITGVATAYNVADYGAVGNFVADDTAAIQSAVAAAQATGGIVYSVPGKTYLVSSAINLTSACRVEFSGSTIKKKSTWANNLDATGVVFYVTGNNVYMRNVVVDGNRAAGAGSAGVWFVGTGCVMENCTISHNDWHGVLVQTGDLTAVRCEASDNSGNSTGNGFHAFAGGVLRTYDCYAASNNNAGFYFEVNAGDGCRLEGRAYQNNYAGAEILSNRGHCPYFLCEQSSQFGMTVGTSGGTALSGWTFDYVETNNTGVAIPGHVQNNSGTGIELYGADHCNFGTVVSKANLGYGLSLATNGSVGCTYNTFHTVTCDQTGAADGDPGIDITGSSKNNTFGTAVVRGHTVGVNMGEGTTGNDSNVFGTLFLSNLSQGGLCIDGGIRNSCQNIVSRDNKVLDLTLNSKAIVTFATANSSLNTVGFVDHDDTGTDHTTVPPWIVYCDANAVNNTVLDGFARASRVGAVDLNGGNYVYLRRPVRRTSLSTLDSGETYTNSAANTTNSQFQEGNGAKKITGGTDAYKVSQRTGLTLNLSTMASTDWFRVFAFVANQSDFNNATPAVTLSFMVDGSNYFTVGWNANTLSNGTQWLYARKGAFTTVGAPSWASITIIQFTVWGHAATAAVTFDDLIIADTKWDRTSTIGQNNTAANITVAASPYVYQNTDNVPLNIMVSGGTVSAIAYSQDNVTYYSQGQTAGIFILNPGDYTKVTYSVAPTMSKVPTR